MNERCQIIRMSFGSHLYGTNTPNSDLDFKSVFIPSAEEILLQRVPRSENLRREKAPGEKNVAGEHDEEAYSLSYYLALLCEGQTVTLDMLFAPFANFTCFPAKEWRELVRNRHRLITKKSAAFVGYCRQQANKYGIKGSRVAASREALSILEDAIKTHGTTAKLEAITSTIHACMFSMPEHMAIVNKGLPNGSSITHWQVCNRLMPFTSSVKYCRDIMKRLVDEYGQRAIAAEKNEGIDWKALSHAVRVGEQALRLYRTGEYVFPLPNADYIKSVKLGERPYAEVSNHIEELLLQVEDAALKSTLPAEPDLAWTAGFITEVYGNAVHSWQSFFQWSGI